MPRPRSTLECCWRAAAKVPAQRPYRRAQRRGDANGAFNLGVLLDEHGDVSGAARAYRFADQRGHAAAACNLGAIRAEHGDISGAETTFNRARERGDSNAVFNLATLLSTHGHPEPDPNVSPSDDPPLPGLDFPGVTGRAICPVDATPGRAAGFGRQDSYARPRGERPRRRREGVFTARRLGLAVVRRCSFAAALAVAAR